MTSPACGEVITSANEYIQDLWDAAVTNMLPDDYFTIFILVILLYLIFDLLQVPSYVILQGYLVMHLHTLQDCRRSLTR